jgi:hypothetical protein
MIVVYYFCCKLKEIGSVWLSYGFWKSCRGLWAVSCGKA